VRRGAIIKRGEGRISLLSQEGRRPLKHRGRRNISQRGWSRGGGKNFLELSLQEKREKTFIPKQKQMRPYRTLKPKRGKKRNEWGL